MGRASLALIQALSSTLARVIPVAQDTAQGSDMSAIVGSHGDTPYFSEPLIHLGDHDVRFSGIFIPDSEFGTGAAGITSQFLESADLYHSKYTSDERSAARQLEYEALLKPYGYVAGSPQTILDVGAGSGGNTFIPLSRMFPGSHYVATDLSPNLLTILHSSAGIENLSCAPLLNSS